MQCGLGPDSSPSSQPCSWALLQISEQVQIFTASGVYEFPKAAVTNYHTFGGLKPKTTEIYSLSILGREL